MINICDAHNDFLTYYKKDKEKVNYIKEIVHTRNIKKICCVVWTSKLKNPIAFLKKSKKICTNSYKTDKDSRNFRFIKKGQKSIIKNCKLTNKKILLSIEDLSFIKKNNYSSILKEVIKLHPFSCGLTWNDDNDLGGGADGVSNLTPLGKKIIQELENNKIIIDTAHMNRKTFYSFCKISKRPIYNSHTNLDCLYKHKRNLTNKQIKTIVCSNGFIGLSFVSTFISNKIVDCKKVAQQVGVFVSKFGDDNVGLGTDFFGTNNLPTNLQCYKDLKNLKMELLNIGLTPKTIGKIFYKNFLNFINRIEN